MVTFEERDLLGGRSIVVSLNRVVVGKIRPHGSGYAYFNGPNNLLNPSFQEEDLEVMKERVEALVRAM